MQKTAELCYETFIKNHAVDFTILESFQIMLPGGGTVVAFCEKILALGEGHL